MIRFHWRQDNRKASTIAFLYKLKKIISSSTKDIYQYKNIGLVKVNGIGSPNAVVVFEELITTGGKNFLNIGMAGGFHHEGVFLCQKASSTLNAVTTYIAATETRRTRMTNFSEKSAPSPKLPLTRIIIATIAEGKYFASE